MARGRTRCSRGGAGGRRGRLPSTVSENERRARVSGVSARTRPPPRAAAPAGRGDGRRRHRDTSGTKDERLPPLKGGGHGTPSSEGQFKLKTRRNSKQHNRFESDDAMPGCDVRGPAPKHLRGGGWQCQYEASGLGRHRAAIWSSVLPRDPSGVEVARPSQTVSRAVTGRAGEPGSEYQTSQEPSADRAASP